MNSIRISILLRFLGLVLLAVCFNAGHASAQMFQGKFTLPFEARWGQAILPAGEYSFKLDGVCATCALYLSRGTQNVAMILAWGQYENHAGHAELSVVRGTVRTLRLPEIGVVLQYPSPQRKHLTAPEERELARIVPITTSRT
ncbi:MAG: hypothetical protein ABSF71_04880 [Terriglobia bacterium]|jgi:hypothetical protein